MAKRLVRSAPYAGNVSLGEVWRTYNRLLHGMRWPFVLAVVVVIIASASGIAIPWIYKLLFDIVSSVPPSPTAVTQAIQVVVWLAVVSVSGFFIWRISGFLTAWAIPKASERLHQQSFSYLIRHSYRFFTDQFAGSLVRQLNRFVDSFLELHEMVQWEFIPLAMILTGAIISLTTRSMFLGGLMFVWVVMYLFVNYRLAIWKLKYDEMKSEADSHMVGELSDVISNSLNVKFFAAYSAEEKRYGNAVGNFAHLWRFTWNLSEIITAIQVAFFIMLEIAIVYLAVRAWGAGSLTVGDLALIQAFIIQMIGKLWDFGRHVRRLFELSAQASEMVHVFETPHEVSDVKGAKALRVERGVIEFKNISFHYREELGVLHGFHLSVQAGEKVALVGPSGAGKSTVTKLLLRLFDLTAGTIEIDGQNIAAVTLESLWRAVSFVPQEPILFHRSLGENIRYGQPKATEKEIIAAAKKARCHEFIRALPQGYDTYVGERGVKLSGGERQRVAIARAILKNAPILVLDEATSSLDSESELLIQESLAELMRGKTVMVIAHRLSTIMKMDRIVVMQNGKIIEMGTHQQLLEEVGTYQRLWNIQAGGFI